MTVHEFDLVVLGAGRRGLTAALDRLRVEPSARVLVAEAAAVPGGSIRTQRSNGYVCELGPFAFAPEELEPLLHLLPAPPTVAFCLPEAHSGFLFDGQRLAPAPVDPLPLSFPTGNEELVQACRRALGPRLWLGREATAIAPLRAGFVVTLGGEVPTQLTAAQLMLAVPPEVAARLCGALDRELPEVAARIATERRAFVFLGADRSAPELRGYGILPLGEVATPVAEILCCSRIFARRALPGRELVRVELSVGAAAAADDAELAAAAERELRRWTGCAVPFGFVKVHHFQARSVDGATVECDVRLRGLAARIAGFRW